jgi:hypothetical protein
MNREIQRLVNKAAFRTTRRPALDSSYEEAKAIITRMLSEGRLAPDRLAELRRVDLLELLRAENFT